MRVRVKICGLTTVADGLVAAEAGADAIGLMFFARSPRHVDLDAAARIVQALPPFVAKVGVFVNPTEAEVREAVRRTGIDTLQFHGEEAPAFCRQFGLKVLKAFRIRDEASLASLGPFDQEAWLLDSYVAGQHGGTGARFDWDLAKRATSLGRPVILAGGLTPDNAASAVRTVHPYGLDVSSGVESAPGRKDPMRVRAFIEQVRAAAA